MRASTMRNALLTIAVLSLIANGAAPRVAGMQQPDSGGVQIPATPVQPIATAVVNFAELARADAARQAARSPTAPQIGIFPEEGEYDEPAVSPADAAAAAAPAAHDFIPVPTGPSPSPASSFQGLDDITGVGTGISFIPPDTEGAVGLTRIFTTLNNNYRVQEKATGATVSTVAMSTFWAAAGASGPFDPKTVYDPFNHRFLVSAVSNASSTDSSILLGVSNTSDPNGTWTLWRFLACSPSSPCGATTTEWWADFPVLGFNMNWAAVTVNMFTISTNGFVQSRLLAVDYPTLRSGAPPPASLINIVTSPVSFTVAPVVTYSPSEPTLYAPDHLSSAGRTYRLNTITGTPAAPIYTQGVIKTHTLVSGWAQPGGDLLPQAVDPVSLMTRRIDSGDARIVNAIFRNGHIWYAQTVGLPAGSFPVTRTAAQWIRLDTSGNDVDAGRVDDPTATAFNGGKWYAYPSIAVNAGNDVLLGFSQFSSVQFPSAGYTLRRSFDPAGTMRDPFISQAGLGFYNKTFSGTRNRWGDYSGAQVDPSDDTALWTIQQFSNPPVGTGPTSSRWNTWWVKVVPPPPAPTISDSPDTTTNEDTAVVVNFTVDDDGGAAGVMMSGNSSNTTLVPNANLVFGGSGASRNVTITPALNQFGTTTITLTASDGALIASDPFVLTVNPQNDPPSSTPINDLVTYRDTPTAAIPFTVSDPETPAGSLIVTGNSSNTTLLPNANIIFGGSGASRTVQFFPAAGRIGTATVAITVSDGSLHIIRGSLLTVLARSKGDLNGDGKGDILLRNRGTGQNIGWQMNGTTVGVSAFLPTIADTNWEIKGVGDFNADFKGDVIWRNRSTGQNIIWLMNGLGVSISAFAPTIADTNWEIRGVGDFNGNNKADVIWRNRSTGQNIAWLMDGTTVASSAFLPTIADTNWEIKGVGDFDGDAKADIILRNRSTGQNIFWLMNGAAVSFSAFGPTIADTNWDVVGVGDLNGDLRADVLWRHRATGQNIGWQMNGAAVGASAFLPTIADTNWEIRAVSDADGDGKADVFWRNRVTGQNIIWLMNGLSVSTSAFLPTIADTNWEIVAP